MVTVSPYTICNPISKQVQMLSKNAEITECDDLQKHLKSHDLTEKKQKDNISNSETDKFYDNFFKVI